MKFRDYMNEKVKHLSTKWFGEIEKLKDEGGGKIVIEKMGGISILTIYSLWVFLIYGNQENQDRL